uniref:Uncharacterized protein n=1 Tax=Meloidogyne incognita TaxID=6306 RepID=A0A914KVQ6_MELIC
MQIKNPRMQDASFKLMIRVQKFRYASVSEEENFFNLSTKCYKKETLRKAEEWKILDNNYFNNNQNFTHLFTFHIMLIKTDKVCRILGEAVRTIQQSQAVIKKQHC